MQLTAALREIGLDDLANRAALGEFNEFFGDHPVPLNALTKCLEAAHLVATDPTQRVQITTLLLNTMTGRFDATDEEAEEWTRSEEGQRIMRELHGD